MANNYTKIVRETKRQIKIGEYDSLEEHLGFVEEADNDNIGLNESELSSIILDTFSDVVASEKPLLLLIQGEKLEKTSDTTLEEKRITNRANFCVYDIPIGFVIMKSIYNNNYGGNEITIATKRPQFHVDSRGFIFVANEGYADYYMDYYYAPTVIKGDGASVLGLDDLTIDKAFLDLVAANIAFDIEKGKNKELADMIQQDILRLSAKFSGQNATGANEIPYTDEDARFDRSGLAYGGLGHEYGGLGSIRRFKGFN